MIAGLAVVVLAGGEGRRIGGGKPLRRLGGETLIERAVNLARGWSERVAVAVREPGLAREPDVDEIVDDAAIAGPLAGLAAGLRFAESVDCRLLLTIPCDAPFLPADLPRRLLDALDETVALPMSGGRLHPACGLWWTDTLARLPDYLVTGRRSLHGFAELLSYVAVEWPVDAGDPFFNVNDEDDLRAAELRLAPGRLRNR